MKSGNPALRSDVFDNARHSLAAGQSEVMTIGGTVNKSALLLGILFLTGSLAWGTHYPFAIPAGAIGGLVLALIIIFKPTTSPYLAPFYAAFEGVALGALTYYFELRYPGIATQAISLTLFVFLAMLVAYKTQLIVVTEKFKFGVVAATGGIFLFYVTGWILSLFGVTALQGMHSVENNSWMSIGISLFVVTIAALNLVMDFDFIENGAKRGAPKYMEWYGAFGLIVTLVWLYMELLRLLGKTRR